MTSVHIRVIAAEISRDCSHISAKVAQFTVIIVTSPNLERKFGVGVSRSRSLRSKNNLMGEWERDGGGLLTSTEEHHMKMIFATATLLSIIATPILAQSFDPDEGTGNLDLNWQGGNLLAQSPAIYPRAEAVHLPKHKSGHQPKKVHRNEGND